MYTTQIQYPVSVNENCMEEDGPKTTIKPQSNLVMFTLVGAVHNRFVHVPGLLF